MYSSSSALTSAGIVGRPPGLPDWPFLNFAISCYPPVLRPPPVRSAAAEWLTSYATPVGYSGGRPYVTRVRYTSAFGCNPRGILWCNPRGIRGVTHVGYGVLFFAEMGNPVGAVDRHISAPLWLELGPVPSQVIACWRLELATGTGRLGLPEFRQAVVRGLALTIDTQVSMPGMARKP